MASPPSAEPSRFNEYGALGSLIPTSSIVASSMPVHKLASMVVLGKSSKNGIVVVPDSVE